MKKRSGFTMHTDAMYRDIKEIEYEPTEERNVSLAFKAGKWRFWKFLGIIPLIPYKPKNNLYRYGGGGLYGTKTLNEMLSELNSYYNFQKDGKIYRKATVKVRYLNGNNNEYKYFCSDEEALNYIEELKKKCKDCGNILR